MPPRPSEQARPTPQPARRPRRQPRIRPREDRVTRQVPLQHRPTEDRVTSTRLAAERATADEVVRPVPSLVLPGWRHMATLAAPDLVATVSFVLAFLVAMGSGGYSILFVVPLIIPSLVLGAFNGTQVGQGWRAAVSVNLATMLILFPLLVIRQSTVRVPYLDTANGTGFAAVVATLAVLTILVAVALYTAWTSRQDPESAPLLFLPAAMLVPLLTSATEFAALENALLVAGLIFALAAGLTLVASMLPPVYMVFVGPIALAAEVLFVTLVRQTRIFPVGIGEVGMALFASVIVAAIGLVVLLPAISSWMRQVDTYRLRLERAPG